jgi:uncharacterized protein YndB with AHSA1/START domain
MPKFKREVEIDASIETVWGALTNPKHWPDWFPGVDSIAIVTSVSEGGSFEWLKDCQAGKTTPELTSVGGGQKQVSILNDLQA